MTPVRAAQVFRYVLLAEHLEGAADARPGQAEMGALGRWMAQFYAAFGLDPPEAFPAVLPEPDRGRRRTYFYPAPPGRPKWLDSSAIDAACLVCAWIEAETVCVQLAAGRREEMPADTWTYFHRALGDAPRELVQSRFWLGEGSCCGGLVSGESMASAAAEEALADAGAAARPVVRKACLPNFGWLFDRRDPSDACALFYEDEARAAGFFNDCFPEALIYLKKIAFVFKMQYQGTLEGRIRELEDRLSRALSAARREEGTKAENLEQRLREVCKEYDDFAGAMALSQTLHNTMRINAANLREVLGRYNVPDEGLPGAWRALAARAVEQLAADDRYYAATGQEAEITLRVLQTRALLERADIEREENRLAQQSNVRLTILALLVSAASLSLTLASDDTVKALIDWADGRGPGAAYQFGELILWKLALIVPTVALVFGGWYGGLWLWRKARAGLGRSPNREAGGGQ
jgi:hypothetical protein